MGSDREHDLANSATLAVSASTEAAAAAPVGPTLGRYRLERELGAGGMGVVHAAFDPDLERRIALKVLRSEAASAEAKDRLLREARAMARLTHPNVVTVYEVGTTGGRDFVAMELIQGESLAEWLRTARRPTAVILDAFIAAGRGLAAAHAAGIVHRDFKPHNVLRSRAGRVAVSDFGLAREAQAALAPALDATLPVGTTASSASPLAGLTVTGSLLGTPAYMAPEQWLGGGVTPATDQFAYCVALWEALAGRRPYPGPTLEDLRAQVARGPGALDASRIPRRLRGILRRGLDPAPDRRWPSMEALLVRLVRAQRRPTVVLAVAGGALATAAVLALALGRGEDAPVAGCEPPARDIARAWSPAIAAEMAARTSDAHAAALDTAAWTWRKTRAAACHAAPEVRHEQLRCLDGVLARFDALRQAFLRVPAVAAEELAAQLIDPEICRKPAAGDVPRLTVGPSPSVIAGYALYGRSQSEHKPTDAEIAALIDAPTTEPCARVIATLAFEASSKDVPSVRSRIAEAVGAAEQCADARLSADLLIRRVAYEREWPRIGPRGEAALRRAQVAVDRVQQPDLAAELAALRVSDAVQDGRWDEALASNDAELAGYTARGLPRRVLRSVITRNVLRIARRAVRDFELVSADVRAWRPVAIANHEPEFLWRLDVQDAIARFRRGDATAHAALVELWQARPPALRAAGGRRIEGQVIDAHGRAVAGATVAAASRLLCDSVGIGLPLVGSTASYGLRFATTDASGRFAIDDAVEAGAIAAQLGDLRSRPAVIADRVTLALAPTRRISGKVDLAGVPATLVTVGIDPVDVPLQQFSMDAPVASDGSFSIAGVTLGAVRASVQIDEGAGSRLVFKTVPASTRPVSDLVLRVTSSARTLDVVLRSAVNAPLDSAEVVVLSGRQHLTTLDDLFRTTAAHLQDTHARPLGGHASSVVATAIQPGDMLARFEHVEPGELTACATGYPGDVLDPGLQQRVDANLRRLTISCRPVSPDAKVVVLEVSPQQRLP